VKYTQSRKRRFGVSYYRWVTGVLLRSAKPEAHGASHDLQNLTRNAAGRLAIDNYRRAVIVDHRHGQVVRTLNRTPSGITITDKD
jgi:hypothetical protein